MNQIKNNKSKFIKNNKNNANQKNQKKKDFAHIAKSLNEKRDIGLINGIFVFNQNHTVGDFANQISKNPADIVKYFFKKGQMINVNTLLNEEQMCELCLEFGFDFKKEEKVTKENIFETLTFEQTNRDKWQKRPPVVTIIGHVDHGKTTLLDVLRNSNIANKEHGGITQHIGAYQIKSKTGYITFLDTPGHEAFTEMRSRGTNITDIVVLVVAADDGVKPQTIEAIDHAKSADANIIVFINKNDKPDAKPENVKIELMNHGIVVEEFGGDIPVIVGSAKTKQGLDNLIDTINVISEINDLKADVNGLARGVVIEAYLDKYKGPVATVLVQHGILRIRDVMAVGSTYGIIKNLENENGKKLESASPSTPIVVLGLDNVPLPGDKFIITGDEKIAREIAITQKQIIFDNANNKKNFISLESLKQKVDEGNLKTISIILKADTQGSVEATKNSLEKIAISGVTINIVRASVGAISLSDITLALASSSIVYGFNVRPSADVRKKAEDEKVEIRLHNIIYKIIEEIENVAKGLIEPEIQEVITGQSEVRALFKHSKIGTIAGCHIISGTIFKNSKIRLIRNGVVSYVGIISSLRHEKNEIKEAREGFDCGMTIKNFNDIKEGDIIEGYKEQAVENND